MLSPPKLSPQQTNKGTRKKVPEPQPIVKNAKEISQAIVEKRNKQTQHFRKLLELCQQEISRSVDLNYTHCIFEVPEFLIGHPLYDINESIVYILRTLQENGYKVSYYFPKTIYITWPLEETPDDKINNTFLEMLNSIQTRHTMAVSTPSYGNPLNYYPPNGQNQPFSQNTRPSSYQSTNHHQPSTYPSRQPEIHKEIPQEMHDYLSLIGGLRNLGGLHNSGNLPQIMHQPNPHPQTQYSTPLSDRKIEDINEWMERNIPVKTIEPPQLKPINTRVPKKINNDEIKKALHDPFYLLQKAKEEPDKMSVQSRKSRVSHISRASHHSHAKIKPDFPMPFTSSKNDSHQEMQKTGKTEVEKIEDKDKEKEKEKEKIDESLINPNPKGRARRKKKEIKPISDLKARKGFVLDLT